MLATTPRCPSPSVVDNSRCHTFKKKMTQQPSMPVAAELAVGPPSSLRHAGALCAVSFCRSCAATVSVSSYMHFQFMSRRQFPRSHPPPLPLSVFLLPLPHRSLRLEFLETSRTGHSQAPHCLHVDQLWVSVLMAVYKG